MKGRTLMKRWQILLCVLLGLLLLGCAQNTETPTLQDNVSPTFNDQGQATAGGATVHIVVYDAAHEDSIGIAASRPSAQGVNGLTGGSVARTNAGTLILSSITVTTGNTTPTQTGTATASPSQAQTPSVTVRQDPRTDLTASVPIGFAMPGGMVDQQANAAGRGGTTTGTDKSSEGNSTRWAQAISKARAAGGDAENWLLQVLETMLGTSTPPPASAPAE